MADTVSTELNFRPRKIPKLQKDCEVSKPCSKQKHPKLWWADEEDDEYLRQYMLFHYLYEKTQGFTINWELFDYTMPIRYLDNSPLHVCDERSNAESIVEMALLAIDKHNEAEGTKFDFVKHIEANYSFPDVNYLLTFWARDMSTSYPESKIYQAKVFHSPNGYGLAMFRLKPTDQEIDAIQVKPPPPMYFHYGKPPIVFSLAGPKDDVLPGVPFVFDRTGAGQ